MTNAISTMDIEDIFNIPRDGRNIQDDSEEDIVNNNDDSKSTFTDKVAELTAEVERKATSSVSPIQAVVEKPMTEKKKETTGMFGDLFEDDTPQTSPVVKQLLPVPAMEPVAKIDFAPAVVPPEVVETSKTVVLPEIAKAMSDPVKVVPKVAPPTVVKAEVLEDIVSDDDDSDKSPCQEWTADEQWLLDSPSPKYDRFYQEKRMALRNARGGILLGGEINFSKYLNELAELSGDISINTYDLEQIYQKMQLIQQFRERCKQIQLHTSQQFYLWERFIELFHGVLCRVEYERGKQDGLYYEHMRDMEHYHCSLKALHTSTNQVMKTLDGGFECLSRQVTIALPMKDMERYGNQTSAPKAIKPEQKKFDALGVSSKPVTRDTGESGIKSWI